LTISIYKLVTTRSSLPSDGDHNLSCLTTANSASAYTHLDKSCG
jgi:hypothetical protein